jgi:hypothetical protein
VTAFFEVTDYGRIIVDKVTIPSDAGQEFVFTATGGPGDLDQEFTLTGGASPYELSGLEAGLYEVGEAVPSGWEQVGSTCSDGSSPDALDLDPGETVTCTFTNQQTGACSPPAAPGLASPPDGHSTQEGRPTFEWSAVAGAEKYRLRLVDVDTGIQVLSIATPETSHQLDNALPPDTYYWRVRALNDCGAGNWALRRSITILPTRPGAPELLQPRDGSLVCETWPILDWQDAEDATGYWLQVDNDSGFSSPAVDGGLADSQYRLLQALSPGGYYWRVLASNSAGDSDWSPVWRFVQGRCIHLPLVTRGAR